VSESQNIEYKLKWQDEYLKWICGFANAIGGSVFVGVNDDGSIVGITNYKRLMEEIPNKTRNLMGVTVTINLRNENNKYYLQIITPAYSVPCIIKRTLLFQKRLYKHGIDR